MWGEVFFVFIFIALAFSGDYFKREGSALKYFIKLFVKSAVATATFMILYILL